MKSGSQDKGPELGSLPTKSGELESLRSNWGEGVLLTK